MTSKLVETTGAGLISRAPVWGTGDSGCKSRAPDMKCPNCGNDLLNLVYEGQDADGYKIRSYVCDECGWDEDDDGWGGSD